MDRAEAFSQVYREEWPRMVGLVGRAVPRGEAEDVVAQAFADAWRTAREMSAEELTRYVWRCVWNGCADLHRKGLHRHEADLNLRAQRNGAREFERAEARVDIERVWGRLTERQREALACHFLDDQGYPEIAARWGLQDVAARRAAFRGWQRMRQLLTGTARRYR